MTTMQNLSPNGSMGDDSFSLVCAALDVQNVQKDEVAQAKVLLDYMALVRRNYEELCYNCVNEFDESKKMHADEVEKFRSESEKKMLDVQAELSKRTDELKSIEIKKLAADELNTKLQAFFETIHDQIKQFFDEICGKANAVEENECHTVSLNNSDDESQEILEENQQQLDENEENGHDEEENGCDEEEHGNEHFDTATEEQMEQDITDDSDQKSSNEEGSDEETMVAEDIENEVENEQPEVAKTSGELMPAPKAVPSKSISSKNVKKSITLPKAVLVEKQLVSSVSEPGPSKIADVKNCFRCGESFAKESVLLVHLKLKHGVDFSSAKAKPGTEHTPGKYVRPPIHVKRAFKDEDGMVCQKKIKHESLIPSVKRKKM